MTIPKYNEMYREFLESIEDGNSYTLKQVRKEISKKINLSEDDLMEMLPSGKQRTFDNRVGWCKAYLQKAELISSPAKGKVVITDEGKELLRTHSVIVEDDLKQSKSFRDFKKISEPKVKKSETRSNDQTPQEIIEKSVNELNNALSTELLDEIIQMDPYDFEKLVVNLLVKMGYGELKYGSSATKKSSDEGIDGIVTADKLGFDSIYIQAKRYNKGVIGRPDIQKFVGALAGQGSQKGIFITTSQFSKEAIEYALKNLTYKIILIDGEKLASLMIEYNLGVSVQYVYEIKRIDTDYFSDL